MSTGTNDREEAYNVATPKTISFLNYKGGVGKTNVTVNFAYHAADDDVDEVFESLRGAIVASLVRFINAMDQNGDKL